MSDYTNSGIISRNEKKTEDKHPDYTGKINVEGKEFRLAGWVRKRNDGGTFLSLKVSENKVAPQQTSAPRHVVNTPDSDLPF